MVVAILSLFYGDMKIILYSEQEDSQDGATNWTHQSNTVKCPTVLIFSI